MPPQHLGLLCWGTWRGAGRWCPTSTWREVQGRPQLRLEAGLQVLETSRAPGLLLFLVVLVFLPSCAIPSGLPGGDRAGPVDFGGPPRISVVPRSGAQISSSCLQSSLPRAQGLAREGRSGCDGLDPRRGGEGRMLGRAPGCPGGQGQVGSMAVPSRHQEEGGGPWSLGGDVFGSPCSGASVGGN